MGQSLPRLQICPILVSTPAFHVMCAYLHYHSNLILYDSCHTFLNNNIESLALFNTDITGEIPDLSSLQNLEVFKVENCKLSGDGFTSLYNIPSLIALGVAGNDEVTGTLDGIENLVNLQELYLGETKMSGPLPEGMKGLTKLKFILSPETAFTGVMPDFSNLVDLEQLDFASNSLTGELPEFGQLSKLKRVVLNGNGEYIRLYYAYISLVLNESRLYIGNEIISNYNYTRTAAFTGALPVSIGDLVNIEEINMSDNSFSSDSGLPTTIGQWKNVQLVDFRNSGECGLDYMYMHRIHPVTLTSKPISIISH